MKRTNQLLCLGSFALLMVTGTTISRAQTPHTIQVQVEGLNQDTVYLAHYYGNKLYYSDTTVTDAEGRLSFPGRLYEQCGKHAIVIPGPKYFEFMAVTEDIVIETKASDPSKYVNVIESNENKVFYEFLGFIGERRHGIPSLDGSRVGGRCAGSRAILLRG